MRRIWVAAMGAVLVAATIAGCSFVPPAVPVPSGPTTTTTPPRAGYRVLGGLEQLYVVDGLEGDRITVSADGTTVATGTIDRLGSLAVRELQQGRTYTVTNTTSGDVRDVRILRADEQPPQDFYTRTRTEGGPELPPDARRHHPGRDRAAAHRPEPGGRALPDGDRVLRLPGGGAGEPFADKIAQLLGLPADPTAPGGETAVGSLLMRLAGFAVVSVQLRGTGCSGGESDLFDLPTTYDGYDAVETVGVQPWVKGGRVGLVGISFSGFSQLAVASTNPPHLAAVAPMSFLGSLYDVGHPGGIFNDGFAKSWIAERVRNARPAPDPGALPYANELVKTDPQCRENQRLRLQTRDGDGLIRSESVFGDVYVRRDFREMMKRIEVPDLCVPPVRGRAGQLLCDPLRPGPAERQRQGLADPVQRPAQRRRLAPDGDPAVRVPRHLRGGRAPEPKLLVNLLGGIIFGRAARPCRCRPPWRRPRGKHGRSFESSAAGPAPAGDGPGRLLGQPARGPLGDERLQLPGRRLHRAHLVPRAGRRPG